MTLAVTLSQLLPEEIQLVIARNLNDAIDAHRSEAKRNRKHPISVNPMHVLGIYKASARQRWYDPNQPLFRAYNFMGTLPEPYLVNLAGHIIVLARDVHNTQQGLIYRPVTKSSSPAVVTILQSQGVTLEEGDDGFRLVEQALGRDTTYMRPLSAR
jgi:hypothetical protein